jgi:hypothetical protein
MSPEVGKPELDGAALIFYIEKPCYLKSGSKATTTATV